MLRENECIIGLKAFIPDKITQLELLKLKNKVDVKYNWSFKVKSNYVNLKIKLKTCGLEGWKTE